MYWMGLCPPTPTSLPRALPDISPGSGRSWEHWQTQEGERCTAPCWRSSRDNGPQAATGIQLLIPFSRWETAWKPSALYLRHPEESPWAAEGRRGVQWGCAVLVAAGEPGAPWYSLELLLAEEDLCPRRNGSSDPGARGDGSASWEPAWLLDPVRAPSAACPSRDQRASVASPARRHWPRFPSALEKGWKEVRQPPGSAGSLWMEPCLCPRPPHLHLGPHVRPRSRPRCIHLASTGFP